MIKGFQRIGIELKSNEISLLQERLDLKKLGNFEIEPLMQIMAGIPTRQFLPNSIVKLAKLVMAKDWDEKQLRPYIDPKDMNNVTLEIFKKIMNRLNDKDFVFTERESVELFEYVSKCSSSTRDSAKLSIDQLQEFIYQAVYA